MNMAKVLAALAVAIGGVLWWRRSQKALTRPPMTMVLAVPPEGGTEYLEQVVCACAKDGGSALDIALCAGTEIYPEVAWPSVPGDHNTIVAAWELLTVNAAKARADEICKTIGDGPRVAGLAIAAKPAVGIQVAKTVLAKLTADVPTGGMFYRPRKKGKSKWMREAFGASPPNESPIFVMRQAVHGDPSDSEPNIVADLQLLAGDGSWNRPLYGEDSDGYWASDGQDVNAAFNPAHLDVAKAVKAGTKPHRMAGNSYGTLYIPTDGVWADGSSKASPPPEFFDMLETLEG